jgi:NitT/TauT family transport system substrate-binding protein
VLLLGLSACARPTGQPPLTSEAFDRVNVAYSEIAFVNLPMWVAKEEGIFEKNGIDANLQLINSSNAVAALLSGQVQVAQVGGSETLSADLGGADLEIVATPGGTYPYLLEAQPGIQTTDDLRGKKIGVSSPGSSSDIATRAMLHRLGLDPDKDVTIVPVGSIQNRTAAMLTGAIDAALDSPPGSLTEEAQGMHPLVDLASLNLPASNNSVVMQRSFVTANPSVVQRYVDSIVGATARIRSDRDLAVRVLEKYYNSDDDAAMGATYDYLLELMPDLPYPRPEQFTDVLPNLAAKNDKAQGFDVSTIMDPSFVQSAADRHVNTA